MNAEEAIREYEELAKLLHHSRDVHPTWASVDNVTVTLRVWDSKSTKSDEDLASF